MANATDVQMQAFCDQRLRPNAEVDRHRLARFQDDKNNIGDEYARASSVTAWADNRTDGPPHLLQAGNSANPDDMLNYNSYITAVLALYNGTGESDAIKAGYVNTIRSSYTVFQRATVRAPD